MLCGKWPRGLTDKASDFESEDCEFESRRGRVLFCFIGNTFAAANFFKILQRDKNQQK